MKGKARKLVTPNSISYCLYFYGNRINCYNRSAGRFDKLPVLSPKKVLTLKNFIIIYGTSYLNNF